MSEWWTYRVSDFILFSPDTYYRLFALYHHRTWPVQIVLLGLGAMALFVVTRPARSPSSRGRIVCIALAACWLWTGVMFHLVSYATINWAARYFGAAFVIQAGLLLWCGARGRFALERSHATVALMALVAVGIAAPTIGLLSGREWDQVELLGLTPDPTAVATIILLCLSARRLPTLVLVIPLAWCLVGGLTLYALGSLEAWSTWGFGIAAMFIGHVARTRSDALHLDRN
jgi:hypothetical protein